MKPGIYVSFNKVFLEKREIEKHNDISIIFLECFSEELIEEANGYNVILLTKDNMKFLPRHKNGKIDCGCFYQASKEQSINYHSLREEYEMCNKIKNMKEWKQNSKLPIIPICNQAVCEI